MSALTDLFTALANKIRSKTGTAQTYTPLQMVSDGIDDVYAAGYDAGGGGATGIPITPSNASPVSLTTGDSYEMLADGYAIESYSSVSFDERNPTPVASPGMYKVTTGGYGISGYLTLTPSNSAPAAISQHMYKVNSGVTGYAIESYSSITPSNSSPISLSPNSIYKISGGGYAIESYSSITPSSSGTYFSSGIKKMASSGYAYSSKPAKTETKLWENSSPTSNFTTTSVSLSQAITNFDAIGIYYRYSTTNSTTNCLIMSVTDWTQSTASRGALDVFISANYARAVAVGINSTTEVSFGSAAQKLTSSSSAVDSKPGYCIPTKIVGIKYNYS